MIISYKFVHALFLERQTQTYKIKWLFERVNNVLLIVLFSTCTIVIYDYYYAVGDYIHQNVAHGRDITYFLNATMACEGNANGSGPWIKI